MIEIDIIKPLYTADGIINLKVNKKINKGDFLTLFGKSGSGKTTLLRILAGLETPKSGKIVVDKEIWFDSSKKINLAPQKRDVGFVFQDYALFPNMSVKKNLEFALKNKNEIKKVDEIFSTIPSELGSQFAATTILRINKAVLSVLENAYPFAQLGYAGQDKTLTVLETKENVTPLCMAGFNMFMVELEEKVYHKMGKLEQFIDGLNNMLDVFEELVGLER
jgi:ABC-type sugar transport system ATPase subunit